MKKINYIEILKSAWKLTWQNRYLWWFGFFMIFSGMGGFLNFNSSKEKDYQKFMDFDFLRQDNFLWIAIVVFIALLIFMILGIIGRGALIKSTQKILKNENSNFKEGFREGRKYFWKLFSIGLLAGIFVLALAFVLTIPIVFLFTGKMHPSGLIFLIAAVLIFIPALFLVGFTKQYASLYAVLADLKVSDALGNGYSLVLNNLSATIKFTLLFIVLSIAAFVFFSTVLIFAFLPFLILALPLFFLSKLTGIAIALLGVLAVIVFSLLAKSVFIVFTQVAWILFFKEIAKVEKKEEVAEVAPEIAPIEITKIPA